MRRARGGLFACAFCPIGLAGRVCHLRAGDGGAGVGDLGGCVFFLSFFFGGRGVGTAVGWFRGETKRKHTHYGASRMESLRAKGADCCLGVLLEWHVGFPFGLPVNANQKGDSQS